MRALVNSRRGGPEVLIVEDRPDPLPKAGEILIRVKRAGLNFADISARVGLYPDAPPFPMVMGYEVAGTVEAVAPDVSTFKKGDRVLSMCRFGGQASHVAVPANQAQKMPEKMTFDEGAAMPVNYLTAYQMLHYLAPLRPGMKVLIHSAAGGVGLAAIQLCKTTRDVEIFGTASAGKHAMLREAGVHHPIDYRTQDYVTEVKRLTQGRGVHRVLDPLGGKDWEKGYSLLRSGGHLLCFGFANMVSGETRSLVNVVKQFVSMRKFSPLDLMDKNRSVSGINMGHLWHETELMTGHLTDLLRLYDEGVVKPHVDAIFPLSKAGEAHQHVQARKNVGKVIFDCEA